MSIIDFLCSRVTLYEIETFNVAFRSPLPRARMFQNLEALTFLNLLFWTLSIQCGCLQDATFHEKTSNLGKLRAYS